MALAMRLRVGGTSSRTVPGALLCLVIAAALGGLGPTRGAAAAQATPPSYTNPLLPRSGDGTTVDSCPDPAVIRGRGSHAGRWFTYCTNASYESEAGRTILPLPMLVSSNLVDWRNRGSAAPAPSWAAAGSRLWAPDVVYSRTHRRYYLTFTVTDTDDAVSGEPGCATDSAIGVASSASPLGPWRHAAAPLVAPRRTGPGCSFASTIDSDVLGDVVRRTGTLFFGGFRGGVHAQRIRLFPRRAVLTGERRAVTTGRYEAANVVARGGYFYLVVTAGHCCRGALSEYAVFVGRATSPLGPYLDREGNSLLAQRTGGSPFLSSRGRRWTATGHTSLFRDHGGRWWTAYHAVDLARPAFGGQLGSTRRQLMLDPVDWDNGWPSVRAGRGASTTSVPGPAAQPGQTSAYRADWLPHHRPGSTIPAASDEFEGESLAPGWTWVREPDPDGYSTTGGRLELATSSQGLSAPDGAPVLTIPAPEGSYVVETAVRLGVPGTAPTSDHVRAGLVVYGDDERYISLFQATPQGLRTTAFGKRIAEPDPQLPSFGAMSVGPPGDLTGLRVVHEHVDGHALFTAYTRQDGRAWIRGGTWQHDTLGATPRIGVVAFGAPGYSASFDYVRTWTLG